jgi:hypothetical protein
MTTFYYDPTLDVHHRLPAMAALVTSLYAAPQEPVDARRLFDAAVVSGGLDRELDVPLRPNRMHASALVLSREWGLADLNERVSAAVEASYEPTWDRERGEFTWGMGLGEEHPRGQFNAFLAAAESAGPGAWERLSAAPLKPCPQVVGVDFPAVALSQAEWIDGALHLTVAPRHESPGDVTSFTIVGASADHGWAVQGSDRSSIEGSPDGLVVTTSVASATLRIVPS